MGSVSRQTREQDLLRKTLQGDAGAEKSAETPEIPKATSAQIEEFNSRNGGRGANNPFGNITLPVVAK